MATTLTDACREENGSKHTGIINRGGIGHSSTDERAGVF
jgi:hypothetical protein